MPSLLRRSLAEAFGTFAFVFIGTGAVAAKYYPDANYGLFGIATAHGLMLAVMITVTMAISGGHLNPAVTLGLFVTRHVNLKTTLAYIPSQLIGAVLASLLLNAVFPVGVTRPISLGTPAIGVNIMASQAMVVEAILTFFLVSAVFGTCVNAQAPKVGGFGIGLVVLVGVLVGGPATGAAMNPARAFGPALVSGQWIGHAVYWVGPIVGAILAALLWEHVLLPRTQVPKRRRTD